MDLDSEVESRSQPSINPMLLDNVRYITLVSFLEAVLKLLSNDWLPSSNYCCILGLLTTTRNKRVSRMCVHNISRAGSAQY
jgi:hypothetical protein